MIHCDTVVIGQGRSGRAAAVEAEERGRRVATLDARVGRVVSIGVPPEGAEGQRARGRLVRFVERDVDRGFMMGNPEGFKGERWFHAGGCRRWQTIERDTTV